MTNKAPHPTSIAVWSVPAPVVVNRPFTVSVGVKCSVGCQLTGQLIVVRDAAGIDIGKGRLGETPARGTSALYETVVNLVAPGEEGVYSWIATFADTESARLHQDTSATFSFRAARPPEHSVTVAVLEKNTAGPIENVQVRLGVYRASTDDRGRATLEVPRGKHDLNLRKVGYETVSKTVEVTENITIEVRAVCVPDTDPDDEQVWM